MSLIIIINILHSKNKIKLYKKTYIASSDFYFLHVKTNIHDMLESNHKFFLFVRKTSVLKYNCYL